MATDIVETIHPPPIVTNDDEALINHLMEKVISLARDVRRPTDTDPFLSKNLARLPFVDVRGRKVLSRQGLRAHR
jgi:hypothetical protein